MDEVQKPKYYIDLQWYEARNRSFRLVAQGRFCPACQRKVEAGEQTQERVPTVDPKTGRVVFELRTVPYGANPLQVIRTCCSKQRNYITPETPLREAIFRVFLANGNQPMEAERIREFLGEYINLADRPHGYNVDLIERLIQTDTTYGLREFRLAEAA